MSEFAIQRIIGLVLVISVFGISGYFRRKADKEDKPVDTSAENQWVLRIRNIGALVFYLSMLTYLIYPPLIAWAALPWPGWLRWAGLGLMAMLLPFLFWMFSSLGKNITPTVKTRTEHQLIVSGPYRYIRHPLYTFGFLFFLGVCLLAGNMLMIAGAVVGIIGLALRTRLEEELLLQRFGDQYKEYMIRTGRYFPKFR